MFSRRAIVLLALFCLFASTPASTVSGAMKSEASEFKLELEWEWTGVSSPEPQSNSIHSMPVVADLDLDGLPEIIFHTAFGENYGILRVIAGYLKGAHICSYTEDPDWYTYPNGNIAVGNIDDDDSLEIIAPRHGGHGLVAFEHDLTPIWSTESEVLVGWGGPCIANLDCEGPPEIIVGNAVFDNLGNLLWEGSSGRGSNQDMGGHPVEGPLSCVADLDMDGFPEIVAGNAAYHYWPEEKRGFYWDKSDDYRDGFPSVANFDNDAYPEIAVVSSGLVRLLRHDGKRKWDVAIPGSPWPWGKGGVCGSPPLVADVNNDGILEIGTSGRWSYAVIVEESGGGVVMWDYDIHDPSSSSAGSAAFDFDADGDLEIVYADERNIHVFDFDGSEGKLIASRPNVSGTWLEIPVIADVDTDCVAEIVIASNSGIRVFGTGGEEWPNSRRIWNQQTYHVTNVNDDGSIPEHENNSWTRNNDYRSQEVCIDVSPPDIVCPPDTSLRADRRCQATYDGPRATATDDCDGAPEVSSSPKLPVTFRGVGTHVIVWSAVDCEGRRSSCEQEVAVIDVDPPEITCPSDTALEADRDCQAVNEGPTAKATDNCDPDPEITSVPPLPATFAGVGDHQVIYTATDEGGNYSTCTQTVTVVDVTPPEIECPPDTTLEADNACHAVYRGPEAKAVDNCDPKPAVISAPPLPATFSGVGDYQIIYTATDESGNYSTWTQTVTVADATPPEIECPPDVSVEPENFDCLVTYGGPGAAATDNCDSRPTITSQPPLPAVFGTIGDHTIAFFAVDSSGNASLCTMTVTVLPTSHCLKHESIILLQSLRPTGDRHLDREIDKMISHIEKSLNRDLWTGAKRLGCKHGHKVFNEEKTAIVHLAKEINKKKSPQELADCFRTGIDMLLDADDILTQTQLDDACRHGGDRKHIEKAKLELALARYKRVEEDYIHAVDHFRKGWDEACKALQKAEGGGSQVATGAEPASEFRLFQNEPNPFSDNTAISFTLPFASHVTLNIYDISGRLVATLISGELNQGLHSVIWGRTTVECGVYFYKLTTDTGTLTRKMVLLR